MQNNKRKELIDRYNKTTITEQKILLDNKTAEFMMLGCEIAELNIPNRWIITFTALVYGRGWVDLDMLKKEQMETIGTINSESVHFLANQGKKVGVETLYNISVYLNDEVSRQKAVTIIMEIGANKSKKEIDKIISSSNSNKPWSLFDFDS